MAKFRCNKAGGGGSIDTFIIPRVTSSTLYGTTYRAIDVFSDDGVQTSTSVNDNYLKFEFESPVKITELKFSTVYFSSYGNACAAFKFRGSNDGNTWTELLNISENTELNKSFSLNANTAYKFYELGQMRTQTGSPYCTVKSINFVIKS